MKLVVGLPHFVYPEKPVAGMPVLLFLHGIGEGFVTPVFVTTFQKTPVRTDGFFGTEHRTSRFRQRTNQCLFVRPATSNFRRTVVNMSVRPFSKLQWPQAFALLPVNFAGQLKEWLIRAPKWMLTKLRHDWSACGLTIF
jgi:hypothetical protein